MHAKDTKLTISSLAKTRDLPVASRKKVFWFGLGTILLVVIVAIIWVAWGTQLREREFEANLQKRLELMASSQVQLTDALLETAVAQANRVINSDLFKLYAAEVHLAEDDVSKLVSGPLPGQPSGDDGLAQLSAQLPMMQSLLIEFTRITGYTGGRVVNRSGTVYIATDATTTPLRIDQMGFVNEVIKSQEVKFAPIQNTKVGLVLETFLPIFPQKRVVLIRALLRF